MPKRYDYVLEFQYRDELEDGYQGYHHAHYAVESQAVSIYHLSRRDEGVGYIRLYKIELKPEQLWAEVEEFRTIAEMLEEVAIA